MLLRSPKYITDSVYDTIRYDRRD